MTAALPRALMRLAVSCLGHRRREWALAMQAEFEAARQDGRSLSFALGCLIAAWRALPAHEEGRFTITSHVFAFAIIIPTAALLLSTILADFPYSYLGPDGVLEAGGRPGPLLSEANRFAVPSLAALVLFLAFSHLRIAWLVLDHDWTRAVAAGSMIAAATVTLIIFTGVAFTHSASAIAQSAALAIELAGISALARRHARSPGDA